MIECNIYSGRRIDYQEISEMDAKEYGYPIEECEWLAVETDNIPYDERVGVMYL